MSDPHDPMGHVDHSGIASITGGDPSRAKRLRATLAVVARRTEDPALRSLIVDVLAGRAPVRRALTHPSMFAMAEQNLEKFEEGLERLDDEEREEVFTRLREPTPPEDITPDEVIEELREPTPVNDGSHGIDEHGGNQPPPRPPAEGTW